MIFGSSPLLLQLWLSDKLGLSVSSEAYSFAPQSCSQPYGSGTRMSTCSDLEITSYARLWRNSKHTSKASPPI
ncbi:hypothetical protein RHMOL_Rhmol06G0117700 [Rhododendron molle]|uniref:Uncharacterized protein n=1 Tax=Rhododendron molle TaxID=49168 RepID=A0ACC0NBX4_RHOML|nr:hypothetical protein RHMOL_Rhmol06G0117700 [Rhododendron molle]